ncbi:MAG TPA: heme ABC transporter ATP-binding protein [Chromatiales bacterium]|nr:heme ABC transporter ATP-binding protein [Thiotrichales bacterium]HIP68711.1 heme ABC transporter ATP-binding protein [Chromatiales bacterium]
MLEASHITVQIGQATLLSDVSVSLKPGEVVAVVGPNGAGKSTLLNVLSGDQKITQGEVRLEDKLLTDYSRQMLAKKRAVLPQQSSLAFPFSVLDVVLMGRSPHLDGGAETEKDYRIVHKALAATEVEHLAGRIYTTLSGGERQRVQLARVLTQIWDCSDPGYLLLDEPVSALDLAHQHSMLKLVRKFAEDGAGVLVVLHDLNLALQYCDDVWVLKAGRLTADGKVDKILTAQLIENVFDVSVAFVSPDELSGRRVVISL